MNPTGSADGQISSRWQAIIVAGLLAVYVFLAVSASAGKSVTFDEIKQLSSGYFLWKAPTYHNSPENGIFAQEWAAVPLLIVHPKIPAETGEPWGMMALWGRYYRFFYSMGNNPAEMLLLGRAMIALLGAALGTLIFFWSRELFGARGGIWSLGMFAFCPTMLANGALATADMAVTLGFFAAVGCFWRLSHVVTWGRLLLSCLALVILVLSKMSSILVMPMFALILFVRLCSRHPVEVRLFAMNRTLTARPSRLTIWFFLLVVQLGVVVGALWIFYNFTYDDVAASSPQFQQWSQHAYPILSSDGLKANALQWCTHFRLLPGAYLNGLGFTLAEADRRNAFLWGNFSQEGWSWFFPFAFLIKTPVGSLLLFLLSFAALASGRLLRRSTATETALRPSLYELSPLFILGGVYGFASLTSHLNIGLRHIMPIYPVLFVLAGANVFWWSRRRFLRVMLAVLFLGTMAESLAAWPNYIAFFNQLVGGPRQGYHYLVDSSLDWGQDLPGLRRWLEKNVPADGSTPVYLSYFGTGDPTFYGIKARLLPCFFPLGVPQDFPLRAGVYCISATMLQSVCSSFPSPWNAQDEYLYRASGSDLQRWNASANDPVARARLVQERGKDFWPACISFNGELRLDRLCAYLRHRTPDANVGGSILIYRLSDANVGQALAGPPPE
jgi:hypothetical protein